MTMRLSPPAPQARPRRRERVSVVADMLMRLGHERHAGHGPVVVAVDGRSSSGKTTLASRLRDVVAGSTVVHTDDIAWWHSRFGWDDLLVNGILTPPGE